MMSNERVTCPGCGCVGSKYIMRKKKSDGFDYHCLKCGYQWGDTKLKMQEERLEKKKDQMRANGWEDF